MASPVTPQRKHVRPSNPACEHPLSTPPSQKTQPRFLSPGPSPQSFKSNRGNDDIDPRLVGILTPRRLTASPVARVRDKDKTRKRMTEFSSLDDAVKLLKTSRHIVVLSGAGISTSLNIPDFRSDDGFYSRLSSNIGITTPEEFFSVDFFKRESETFWKHVRPLLPKYARTANGVYRKLDIDVDSAGSDNCVPKYSKTHAFLALLQGNGKLLTNYTQNIDGLEQAAGVHADNVIQCHGSWDTASCMTCRKTIAAKKYLPIIYQAGFPRCKCSPLDLQGNKFGKKRANKKRKRLEYEGDSDRDSDDGTKTPAGLFKPDITFFGEAIPDLYVPRLESDKSKADLIIVLGTSLKVRPVKMMVTEFPSNIPQIWINRDRFSGYHSDMPGVQFDIELLGECDVVIEELCRRAGYNLETYLWHENLSGSSDKHSNKTAPALEPILSDMATVAEVEKTNKLHCGDDDSASADAGMIDRAVGTCGNASDPIRTPNPRQQLTLTVQSSINNDDTLRRETGEPRSTERKTSSLQETWKENGIQKRLIPATPDKFANAGRRPPSILRVEADLDAEWRWRFYHKPVSRQ